MRVILHHWTPAVNVKSILRQGLRPSRSKGKLQVVWMVRPECSLDWIGHIAAHQRCRLWKMRLLEVTIDSDLLANLREDGRCWTHHDISSAQLRLVEDWPPPWSLPTDELSIQRDSSTMPSWSRSGRPPSHWIPTQG